MLQLMMLKCTNIKNLRSFTSLLVLERSVTALLFAEASNVSMICYHTYFFLFTSTFKEILSEVWKVILLLDPSKLKSVSF